MTLSECYQLLELTSGASIEEVKTSYRRLVRHYHPDVNPDKTEWAKAKFIELTHAYESINRALQSTVRSSFSTSASPVSASSPQTRSASRSPMPKVDNPEVADPGSSVAEFSSIHIRSNPSLSDIDNQLKKTSYRQLREFLKDKRFARAIALVEGLVHRIPTDPEVKQWQAIAYQLYARHFANENQYSKAKIYLKKALRVDPHNRKLWSDIKEEFNRLERTFLKRQG